MTRRSADDGDQVALLHHVPLVDGQLGEGAIGLGDDRDLHLHRLEDHQGVALGDGVARLGDDLPDVGHHLGADLVGHRGTPPRRAVGQRHPITDRPWVSPGGPDAPTTIGPGNMPRTGVRPWPRSLARRRPARRARRTTASAPTAEALVAVAETTKGPATAGPFVTIGATGGTPGSPPGPRAGRA